MLEPEGAQSLARRSAFEAPRGVLAVVPARGGSKGVPRKNLRRLGGEPLIVHTIETARRCPSLGRVLVSTDDEEIAAVARRHGAEVPFLRPAALATDTTPTVPVLQHAVRRVEQAGARVEVVVLLEPTSPWRTVQDVETCLGRLAATGAEAVITITEVAHSPYFVMVELEPGGRMRPLIPLERRYERRQDAPRVYRINGAVYAVRRDVLMEQGTVFPADTRTVVMPESRSLPLDEERDFLVAEALLAAGLAG